MTNRKTGAKTTTKGTLTPITKSQFNSTGKMKKTSKPIAKAPYSTKAKAPSKPPKLKGYTPLKKKY